MYVKTLFFQGQTRSFIVDSPAASGWEVRVEQDHTTVRRAHYRDWHRVERAVGAIEREMRELEAQGWQVVGTAGGASVTR